MKYYKLQPEVPGQIDDNTIMEGFHEDNFSRQIDYLHIRIEGWMGDDLMQILCYIVTNSLRNTLIASSLSGFEIEDNIEVSIDQQLLMFPEMAESWPIPRLHWLKIVGSAGSEDFGLTPPSAPISLVVSARAMELLESFHIDSCEVSEWTALHE